MVRRVTYDILQLVDTLYNIKTPRKNYIDYIDFAFYYTLFSQYVFTTLQVRCWISINWLTRQTDN